MGNGYRLCILGYVNGWIGDRVKAGITSVLEFKEKMIMEEECWSSVLKGGCVWVTLTLSTRIYINTQR